MKIGIDPDLVKSGVALVDGQKILELHALSFYDLTKLIEQYPDAHYVVENVEYDKPTYPRPGVSAAVHGNISQKVGMVKGAHRIILQWLDGKGCNVTSVRPLQGIVKKKAKGSAKYFNQITGWTGRSNEDKRDAALLALSVK